MADPDLAAHQTAILAACTQQVFTTLNWPPGHIQENDNAIKKEVDHAVSHTWA